MRIRTFAAAYILNGDSWLMLKRAPTHKLFPDTWAPIGGHIEAQDGCDPYNTVLRELAEEAGLAATEVSNLELRYITIRRRVDELRQLYLYFGRTERLDFNACREGEFYFVPESQLLQRPLGAVNKLTIEYHLCHGKHHSGVVVGSVGVEKQLPMITWSLLEDWGDEPL